MRAQAYAQQMELAGVIDAARRSQGLKQGSDGRWEVAYQPGGPGTAPAATAPTYVTTPASRQQAESARLDPSSRPRERSPFVGMANPRPGPSVGELLGQSVARSTAAPQGQLALAVDQERQRRNSSAVAPLATWPPAKRASEAEKEAVAAAQIATPARSGRENAAGGLPPVTTGLSSVPGQMRTPESEQNLREITRRVVNGVEVGGNREEAGKKDWWARSIQAKAGLPGVEPPRSKLRSGKQNDLRIRPTPVVPTSDRTAQEIEAERIERRAAAAWSPGMERPTPVTEGVEADAGPSSPLGSAEQLLQEALQRVPTQKWQRDEGVSSYSKKQSDDANEFDPGRPPTKVGPSDYFELEMRTVRGDGSPGKPRRITPAQVSRTGPGDENATAAWQQDASVNEVRNILARNETELMSRQRIAVLGENPRLPTTADVKEMAGRRGEDMAGVGDFDGRTRVPIYRAVSDGRPVTTGDGQELFTVGSLYRGPQQGGLMTRSELAERGSNFDLPGYDDYASELGRKGRLLAGFSTFGGRGRAPVGPLGDGRDYAEALKRAKPTPIYRTENSGLPLMTEDGKELFRIEFPDKKNWEKVREEALDLIPGSRARPALHYSPRKMLDLLSREGIEATPVNFSLPPSVSLPDAVKALGMDAGVGMNYGVALDREGQPRPPVIELSRPDPSDPSGRRRSLAVGTRVPGRPDLHWTVPVPDRESRSSLPILGTDGKARAEAAAELGLDRPNDIFRELEAMANADDPSAPSWSRVVEREVDNLVRGRGEGSLAPEVAIQAMGLDTNAGLGRLLMQKYGQAADVPPAARPAQDAYDSADDAVFPVVPIELEDDVRALAMERPELVDPNLLEQMVYGSERENLSGVGSDAMDYTDADEFLDFGREKDLLEPEGLDYGYGGGSRFDDSRLERSPEELRAQAAARAVIARMGGNRTGQQYDQDAELLAERILQVAPPAPAALQPDPYGVRTPVGPFKDGGAYAKALKQRSIDELVTLAQIQAAERLYNPPLQSRSATPWRQDPGVAEAAAFVARRQQERDAMIMGDRY